MLDLKFIRENPDKIKKALSDRSMELDIGVLLEIDTERRGLITEVEKLKAEKNKDTEQIAQLKQSGGDATEKIAEMKAVSQKIGEFDKKVGEIDKELAKIMLTIPNIPHNKVPVGAPDKFEIVSEWGKKREFSFEAKDHVALSEYLDVIDFARGAKLTGSHWVLYKGKGALLERALINFMLDIHTTKHGYREISPPFIVNRKSMTGTGQLPKME